MTIVFRNLPDGGFVCGNTISRVTAYAYPTSDHAETAKRAPAAVAATMMMREAAWITRMRRDEFDARNWALLEAETT